MFPKFTLQKGGTLQFQAEERPAPTLLSGTRAAPFRGRLQQAGDVRATASAKATVPCSLFERYQVGHRHRDAHLFSFLSFSHYSLCKHSLGSW